MPEENSNNTSEIRCPRLGSPVTFSYCETESSGQPCLKCISCWTPYFDVAAALAEKLGSENLDSYFSRQPKPKVVTLIELIEKARKTVADSKNNA
jgi:hypothetical protein